MGYVIKDGLEIAYGLYIYHVDAPNVGEKIGKFGAFYFGVSENVCGPVWFQILLLLEFFLVYLLVNVYFCLPIV